MKRVNPLFFFLALSLSGCTQWEKNGATPLERKRDLSECNARGYEVHRPDIVTDVEFSYQNKYRVCEKGKGGCDKGYRYDKEPEFKTVHKDRNASARFALIDACMYRKGWYEKTHYWSLF
ncbi:hypothetical protein NE897_01475 [Yersinia ruckeri]|uniref:hypothetical protein n=1 Tax=Yersinia ruckeri TaxID=29486 RepID=UPI0005EA82F7|nr:hypothetical protein [Yersinia ruckeri]AKA37388.1 hypothetical protein UGYR_02570 [Yersinia ruckeri]EKN3346455.1 hypothetical protein [Yersinia ruckeri]EKN3360951.1 hypothetical protein [Yersinia ruckeri]EKN4181201.1 hypothetical protein [Yersinia ruckeri]EKN4200748.1 hypothetical protein [Yersinia ruckeri]